MMPDICFRYLPTHVTYAKILAHVRDHDSDFMVIVEPCIQMSKVLKIKCNFTLRWLVDLGSTFLEQSLRFELFALYP